MYIFGYGSLMNSHSLTAHRTNRKRHSSYCARFSPLLGKIDDTYTISPLVVNTGEGQVNGVLLELMTQLWLSLIAEKVAINVFLFSQIKRLKPNRVRPKQAIWVYVTEQHLQPCEKSPIVQSYVDTSDLWLFRSL